MTGIKSKKVNFYIHQIDKEAVMPLTGKSSPTITGMFSCFQKYSAKKTICCHYSD